MKAKKKTNHLQEEADKIEHIPEEKNNGRDGQDKPIKAKKPRKNRFLACLRKTWARFTGCIRCSTTIQKERSAEVLPTPSGIIMEEELPTSSGIIMEEELQTPNGIIMGEELQTPSRIIMEEELPTPSGIIMGEEFQTPSGIIMEEELPTPSGTIMEEELQTPSGIIMGEELQTPSRIIMEEELPRPIGINMEKELLEPSDTNMEEELPGSSINIEDSKANMSPEEQEREIDVEENQNIETNYEEAELVKDSFVEQEIQAQYQRLNDLIHILEDLCAQCNATQLEIRAEFNHINDQIQSLEDLYIQHYNAEDAQSGEEKLEDNEEVKIKEVGENGESIRDSQRASYEMPGPSNINSRDNESSKGKEKDCNKGENTGISINTEREECRSEQSSSNGTSLDAELHKSTNTSQSCSSHYEEPIPSNNCMEKPEQPGEVTPATVPLTLQSFIFHRTLGEGAFGKVYLARDIIRNECVAVKVTNKQEFTSRTLNFRECNILKRTHMSPHLIHGLAAFHTAECVYYVMELATRGDLLTFMRKNRPLDHPTIQFITSEVICGTQFLHTKGFIHRDLKPDNILLCADGHVKIADFGIAARMDANGRIKGRCIGTLQYMAPEVVRCQEYGQGVDYFAIGVILYQMYTYKVPFKGKNTNATKLAILEYTPHYPESLTPDTLSILQGLLHKDQHQRLGVEGDVRKHPYFSNINWEDVEARRFVPPAIMTAASVKQNIKRTLRYKEKRNKISAEEQKIFEGISFLCPEWSHQYHLIDTIDTIETKSWMANLFDRRPFRRKEN